MGSKKNGDNFLKKRMAEYEKYLGKYTRTSAEKYEEFLKELDVSWPLRKLALASTPVLEVTYDADSKMFNFKTSTIAKSMELKFKLDEEFEESTPDGRQVKAKVTLNGDTFESIQNATKEGQKSTKVTREFKGDEVIQTAQVIGSDLVCVQVFKNKKILRNLCILHQN